MRRSWCLSLATLAVAGSTLLATSAAEASSAPPTPGHIAVQPGGLVTGLTQPFAAQGHKNATSTNWSGYAGTTGRYTSVSASWTQPAGVCSRGDQYAAFWVGLDGYTSSTVEQTGSEVDCVGREVAEVRPPDDVLGNAGGEDHTDALVLTARHRGASG